MTATAAVAQTESFRTVPLGELKEHPQNPRSHFDAAALAELTASVRDKGVLYPLLVRPNGKGYQILGGARRFRAAKEAGLTDVPVLIRALDDNAAFELMVVDNLQRADIHPLDEARAYDMLEGSGYDVAKIAARVGRSVKYVYDRMKLLELTPEAQELFLAGKFTAGHAILLARLKPEDQKRALDLRRAEASYGVHGVFTAEHSELPFGGENGKAAKRDPYAEVKAVSVRELQSWIQDKVKFDRDHVDAMLFPETAATLQAAAEDKLKVVLITREYQAGADVRDAAKGERIYGAQAWRRADGKPEPSVSLKPTKTCDRSRVGLVACGPGQGEAFRVCVDKERCTVHWAAWQKERKKRQAATGSGGSAEPRAKEQDRWKREQAAIERERKEREADHKRWVKARPAILVAIAAAVRKAPTKATGLLGEIVVRAVDENYGAGARAVVAKLLPRGATAEDLVRFAALIVLARELHQWHAPRDFPKRAREFGVDVRKIVDTVAPEVQTNAEPEAKPAKKGGKP